jgi:putative transposase
VYWRRQAPAESKRRPGLQGPYPDDALVGYIRPVLLAVPFHGEGYRKGWARLWKASIYLTTR